MKKRRLRAPSPALVISVLALFVALGGTSYAALAIPKNSVGTAQLKNNAVSGSKIKNGAVTSSKLSSSVLAPEAWHEIGATGQPAFQNSWANEIPGSETTAAFYKDAMGVVHLKGIVNGGTNGAIFTLPAGYRPSAGLGELVYRTSGSGLLAVYPTGDVDILAGTGAVTLDGVTFRIGE